MITLRFVSAQGLPVDCSEYQALLLSDAAAQIPLKVLLTALVCFTFSIGQLRHRFSAHLWMEILPGDPFHQQNARRNWPTTGGRRELPGEGVWLMQLAGVLYQKRKGWVPSSSHCVIFFCFLCLDSGQFRARWDQVQSQFPIKQKPLKVNKQVSANGKKEIHALKLH